MRADRRGRLWFLAKCLVAAALLVIVFRQVHWKDYVVSGQQSMPVLDRRPAAAPTEVLVREGPRWSTQAHWRSITEFDRQPATGIIIRDGFASSLSNIKIMVFAAALLSFFLSTFVLAARWNVLLRVQSIRLPFWEVLRWTFLGDFFNTLMPGVVGGDVVKAYFAVRQTRQTAGVLVSLFLDRLLGMAGLACQSAVMLLVVWLLGAFEPQSFRLAATSVAVIGVGLVGGFAFVLSPRFRQALGLRRLYQRLPIARHLDSLGGAAAVYRRDLRYLFSSILLTVVSQVLWIGSVALAGISLGISVHWTQYFLYVPLIYIVGIVPISPGGAGVVEQLFLVCFANANNPSQVLALSVLARLIVMFCSLPGLLVMVSGPRTPSAAAIEEELARHEG